MSAVTKQEIVAMIEGLIESDACMGSISNMQAITALELVNRIRQHGIAYEPKGEEAIAPPDGYLLVHKDIMTLTVECRCGVQQAKPVHHYLKQADEETHRRVDDAVRAGRIFDKRFRGGFVSVPVEPTQEMIDAGTMFGTSPTKVSIIWSNMLAAAPEVSNEP